MYMVPPTEVSEDGTMRWLQGSLYHNDNGPALIKKNGAQFWYQHGILHRADGPAIVYPDGLKLWYKNGIKHRTDGPAIEQSNFAQRLYWIEVSKFIRGNPVNFKILNSREWVIDGRFINEETLFPWFAEVGIESYPFTEEQELLFILTFGFHT